MREKKHRLDRALYKGIISVAFTLCIKDKKTVFASFEIANDFIKALEVSVANCDCYVPVYCFMPDHQHIIITGRNHGSDILRAVSIYKQRTGFMMSKNRLNAQWQKDYYDHIIRKDEDVIAQIRYILDNPVRKGLVKFWKEYPYLGSIGCSLEDVINDII